MQRTSPGRDGTRLIDQRNQHLRGGAMRDALNRHLHLGSVRDIAWVAAHFGHR